MECISVIEVLTLTYWEVGEAILEVRVDLVSIHMEGPKPHGK